MQKIIKENRLVLYLYFIFILAALTFIFLEGKSDSQLIINSLHTPFFDSFFKILTNLGDGLFMIFVGIMLLIFISIRYGLIILSSFLCSSLLVQILKKLIFKDHDRPVLFFQKIGIEFYKIPGLEYHSHFSFPSGHSTTAFALFIGITLFTRNVYLKILLLLIACITAFSRAYLSQHFIEDTIAGSALGTGTVFVFYYFFTGLESFRIDRPVVKIKYGKNDRV